MDENPTLEAATPTPSLDVQGDADATALRPSEADEQVSAASKAGKRSSLRTILQPAIVRAEANTLRFPIFANGTKGLSTLDGFEVIGSGNDGGKSEDFLYRVTRNTDDMYPGDLARRIHHALLAKLELQGFPYRDTVSFTWRELARLMGKEWKGQNKAKYQAAIRSIHGLRITSSLALKQKTSYCDVATKEEHTEVVTMGEREQGFPLYTGYVFQDELQEDGSKADINRVEFGSWLINNLNSFYYAKLDRELWLKLDRVGPIATRLYEYLLFSRSGDWNKLRIRYERLCMFLPVTVMTKEAKAKTQFEAAITALRQHKVISRASWSRNAKRELVLEFFYGDRVRTTKTPSTAVATPVEDDFQVRELRTSRSPQAELLSAFYADWENDPHKRPYQKELDYAREVIDDYSLEIAIEMVPHVCTIMREEFDKAKTFNATRAFWERALAAHQRAKTAQRVKKQQLRDKAREDRRRAKENQVREAAEKEYLDLPLEERQRIAEATQARISPQQYGVIRKLPNILLSEEVSTYMAERDGK